MIELDVDDVGYIEEYANKSRVIIEAAIISCEEMLPKDLKYLLDSALENLGAIGSRFDQKISRARKLERPFLIVRDLNGVDSELNKASAIVEAAMISCSEMMPKDIKNLLDAALGHISAIKLFFDIQNPQKNHKPHLV